MDGPGLRLTALAHIFADLGFTHYRPGDTIPPGHPDAAAWVKSGAARWVPADHTRPSRGKAIPISAPAALQGIGPGGAPAEVGRVPMTPERRRGHWRR